MGDGHLFPLRLCLMLNPPVLWPILLVLSAAATIISKLFGLFRQQAIGAAFAVGPVADAYSFAYIIPGFLLILLGGYQRSFP